MIVYGTRDCPHTIAARKELDELGITYNFSDLRYTINLKQFLSYRDNLDIYDRHKDAGAIGIPTFVLDDGTVSVVLEEVKTYFSNEA